MSDPLDFRQETPVTAVTPTHSTERYYPPTDLENLQRVKSLSEQNLTRIISDASDFVAYRTLNDEIDRTLSPETMRRTHGADTSTTPADQPAADDGDQQENDDEGEHDDEGQQPPYTVFTKHEVLFITIAASCAAFFSTISVPIYLAALTELADAFGVTTELINLTVTVYSIVQGLSPALWGAVADGIGRRPVIIFCLVIYIGANIGLAFAKNYGYLVGFRILQSAGIASTVAVGSGVVGDVADRKTRGLYMGIYTGLSMTGSAIGPLIGGALTASFNWRAIFWFLVIASGVTLVFIILMLPETSRKKAGNGSVRPDSWLNRTPYMSLRRHIVKSSRDEVPAPETVLPPSSIKLYRTMQMFLEKDVLIILLPNAIHYTAWFMLITAQSTLLVKHYNFTTLQLGLSYIANGGGSVVGSLLSGKIMNRSYTREVERFRAAYGEHASITASDVKFNIHRARLAPFPYASAPHIAASLVFGWTIQYRVHYIVPILATGVVATASLFSFNLSSTLMVDLFPAESSSAAAAVNLSRCLLCAAGIAAVDKMDNALGTGGTFSLMSGLMLLSWALNFFEIRNGPRFHQERLEKLRQKERAKEKTASTEAGECDTSGTATTIGEKNQAVV